MSKVKETIELQVYVEVMGESEEVVKAIKERLMKRVYRIDIAGKENGCLVSRAVVRHVNDKGIAKEIEW